MYEVLPHTVPILWGKKTCCSHMSVFHAHVCSCLYKTNFFVRMQIWLLCIDCWGRLSYLSLLFFGTLHSNEYIFPILLCFSLLFFSQLFVRPPQTAILLFFISISWGWSWFLSPVQCNEPPSIVLQALYQI